MPSEDAEKTTPRQVKRRGCRRIHAVEFTVRSDGLPNVERRFTSLRAAAEECGASRVYGGIHYRFSTTVGSQLGTEVAEYALPRYFQPVP